MAEGKKTRTVMVIEGSTVIDDGCRQIIALESAPGVWDPDAAREMYNIAYNAEEDTKLTVTFEEWTEKEIKLAELAAEFEGGHFESEEYDKKRAEVEAWPQ